MRRKESSRAWTGSIPMFASPPCIVLLLFTISCLRNYAASVSGAGAGAEMNPYVYVQANAVGQKGRCRGGLCEENHDEQWSPPGTAGLGSSASCGEEDNPCADIRSGLLAIPDELPEGTRPELRLMAGTYTGDGNVFLGDPSNTRFPASARDVRIVGWETDAGEAQRAVISCEGRLSPSDASSSEPWRGIWLSQGYITELANLTVTDCPGGGVGVDMSQGDEGTLSPATLSSVELHGNGGGKCPIGGGLYVTATTSHGTSGVGPMVLERPRMESDGEAVVTLEGCKIANNTAKLGGGIAVDPTGKPVSLSTEVGRARVAGVTDAAESGSEVNMADPEVEEAEIEAAGEQLQGKRGGQRGDSSGSGVTVNLDAAVVLENVAAFGGGIWASAANVSLGASTVIQGNVAHGLVGECGNEGRCGGEGGGMMSNDGVLSMQGVSFLANRAETYQARDEYARGGGLSVRGSMVNMIGCSFVENTAAAVVRSAAGIGGGAHLDGAKVTVDECTFQDNSARGEDLFGRLASFGGGMAARGPSCSATISNSKFESNGVRRGGSGGAMWVENRATATLVHTSFVNNTAASSYTHKAIGGAISISGSARLELAEGCSLENNVARPEDHGGSNPQYLSGEGGGIHASGAGLSMTGVSLKRNRCETGALDTGCMGGAVSIIGWGAASSPAGDKEPLAQTGYRGAVLHGCSFESNEAKGAAAYSVYGSAGQGGAVAIRCAFPQISYSNFTRNSADGGSGAMPAAGGAVLLFLSGEGCLEAAHGGNKAAPEDTVTKFVNCTFEHNWAGPAFSSVRSSGELLDGGDAGHGAERDARRRGRGIGGALAAVASSPLLDRCLFRNNSAVAASPSSPTRDKAGGSAPVTGAPPSFGGGIVLACNCSGTWVKSCTLDENIAVGGVGGDLAVLTAASVGGSASPEACAIPLGMITTDFDDGGGAPGRTAERGDAVPSLDPRAGGSEIKAVMSDCTFRPAPSRTDPAIIPWSDGQSETTESPFVFILNGGMVDLVSPTFSASGQVFVAEVDRPLVSKKVETGDAHLRIFDSDVSVRRPPGSRSSASSRGGTRSGEDPEERGMSEREISVVSVGGTVSLMGTSAEATTPAANRATLAPFPLQDLLVLGGELVFNNRGVAVSRSARIRMASVSETGSFFRQAGEVGETGGDDDRHDGAVGSGGGSDSGKDWTSRPVAADGMDGAPTVLLAMEVTGSASLGEAWEPKPFFLGTWLSQLFPTPLPASSAELSGAFSSFAPPKVLFEAGEVSSVGGPRDGGGIRDGDDDRVTFTGVDLRLGGDSLVSGKIVLNATSAIKVDPTGRLTLAGNATFKRKEVELRGSIDSAKLESNGASATTAKGDGALGLKSRGRSLPAPPVVSNAGLISIPRGFSLTVDGGIRQEGNGACHLGLPAPLFTPPVEDVGIGEGDDGYLGVKRVYPLVVKSGEVNLAGTVNVSVTSEGGDAERVRIHRKWAIAKFASNESAAKADYGSVSVGAPPGVSMRFSMQQIPDDSDEIRHPVPSGDEAWEQEVESNTAEVPNLAWELQMEVASIECQHVISYANVSATGGPCQACLLNRECAWCAKDGHGACESAAKGPVRGGYGGRKSSCQVGNCCPGGCNGVGQCDFFSATCSCPWLYAGTACGELSTRGAVALSLSLSALALIMLSLACGRSSRRKQMEAVMGTLQELRRGLLSDPDGSLQEDEDSVISGSRVAFPIGTKGSGTAVVTSGGRGMGVSGGAIGGSGYQHMWPKDYIQDLQQNLALRFVRFNVQQELPNINASGVSWLEQLVVQFA